MSADRPTERPGPLGASPFVPTVPALASAVGFGLLALVWLVAGRWLPGGRWVVVHLFTLGVLTTLVAAFTRHFAHSFTGQGSRVRGRRPLVGAVVLDLSVVALLVGRLTHGKVLLALGTAGLLGVVGENLLGLRAARRSAVVDRFAWVVRRYEDAHVAFLLAAVLGTLVGMGALDGGWWVGARDAHVHLNVLGWAGLTVLGTLAVFGPAMLRVRLEPQQEERATSAARTAAVALAVAITALVVASGLAGPVATGARATATLALVLYGAAAVTVAAGMLRSSRRSPGTAARPAVTGAVAWLPVGVAVDVVAVATVQRRLFDVVGVVLFVGVLTQLILAVYTHIAPHVRGRDRRAVVADRLARLSVPRSLLLNLGVAAVAVGLAADVAGVASTAPVVRAGWIAIGLAVVAHLVPVLWPVRGPAERA